MRIFGTWPRSATGEARSAAAGRPVSRLLAALVAAVTAAVALVLAGPTTASAYDYPELSAQLSAATVAPGDTVTIKVTGTSGERFTGTYVGIYGGVGMNLAAITSVVSCAPSCSEMEIGYYLPVGDLDKGDPIDVSLTLRIDADVPPQTFPVRRQFFTDHQGNGPTSYPPHGPMLTITARPADLEVGLAARPRLGVLVPHVAYTLSATNNGPGPVSSATLKATLPTGATATELPPGCTLTAGTLTCTYGAIPAGATVTKDFRVPLTFLRLGPSTVTAGRTAGTPEDPDTSNDTAAVTCITVSIALILCP
ncbi:hypothetical protein ACFYVL_42730 [Streptomyces sp. NPDC004111]|uniref:hypothetical protein n=1 Tax=Streptomyces sp. NPDC004111 TaxID=3364690 RepID=UPI0036BCBBE1